MGKRLLLLASSVLTLIFSSENARAQSDLNLFKLPDTVCNGHEIVPFNIVENAQNYFWTFCPPNLNNAPTGQNVGPILNINDSRGYLLTEDEGVNYSFNINGAGGIFRMRYADGLAGAPSMITSMTNTILTNPNGVFMANDGRWHLFVVAGTDSVNSRLFRYDFNEHGLKSMPTEVNLGNLGGGLNGPKRLYMAKEGDNWFGFTFDKSDALIRLDFGNNLSSTPTLVRLGNIDSRFNEVTGITGIRELDNWHLFVTNKRGNNVSRISFGNSLTNIPFVINLGNMDGRINAPAGIAITKDCDAYYGFVINHGTASFVTLKWDDQSIANQPVATNHGNVAGFVLLRNLTNIARDQGSMFMFATNEDNSVSKIEFKSCTNAEPAYSDLRLPPSFKIDEPGVYTVFLTINEGFPDVRTDCEQMYVYDHPALTVSNDTLICVGDTIRLFALSFGADSFKWVPGYNIDTAFGNFVDVAPKFTTEYNVVTYYNYNCIVKSPVVVTVSQIAADAGPDKLLKDGSYAILGGPGTALGSQYTYEWTPDIGFVSGRNTPIVKVEPPYDITYYLEVKNSDGCRSIDSVFIEVPCDDIHLPNAFKPASSYGNGRFGLMNQQIEVLNSFKIFDRWGKEVFSTNDPKGSWDGTVNGAPAPLGVYVWEVDGICAKRPDLRYRRSGNVTLIR